MANEITHIGTVESTDDGWVKVRIVQASACSSCQIKQHCRSSESKEKVIDVYAPGASCHPGEQVVVVASVSMGLRAVGWAFVVPFVLLLAVLFGVMRMSGGSEALAALASLVALVPYYTVLYLLRGRFRKHFSFALKPTYSSTINQSKNL